MLKITADQVHSVLEWSSLIDAMRDAHRPGMHPEIGDLLLKRGEKSLLVRASMFDRVGIGLKAVTVFPDNPSRSEPLPTVQGEFLLFDEDGGAILASIDGAAITPWKTAADSALGSSLLSRPSARIMTMTGAGTMAQPLIEAHVAARPSIEEIRLWNRSRSGAETLRERLSGLGRKVELADDLETAIGAADIVSSATMTTEPIIKGAWLKPGAHLDLVGAFRPDMREADDEALQRGRLFVDARATTVGHIGEIAIPLRSGAIRETDIEADLFDLCGMDAITRGDGDITIFKNGGGAHLDIITARQIYRSITAT